MAKGERLAVCHPEFLEDLQRWAETDRRTAKRLLQLVQAPGDFDVGAAKPAPTVGLDPSKRRRQDEDLPGFEPDFLPPESGQVVELAPCCGFNPPTGEDLPSLYLFSLLAGYCPVIECFHQ